MCSPEVKACIPRFLTLINVPIDIPLPPVVFSQFAIIRSILCFYYGLRDFANILPSLFYNIANKKNF